MIKLWVEIAKWSRFKKVSGLFGNGWLSRTSFPSCSSQYNNVRPVTVRNFTTRTGVPTPTSSPTIGGDNGNYEEIYSGPLAKRIQFLKIVTLTTSFGTLFILKDLHSRIEFANQAVMILGVGVILLFNFLTPCLINLISKKYCVKIFYDHSKKQYIAHIYTFLFKKKRIVFTPEDVVVPKVNKFFTVAYVKNHPMFFDVNHFKTSDYYRNIMGYDKPIDFRLDNKDE